MAIRNCHSCGKGYYTAESPDWSNCRDCYEIEHGIKEVNQMDALINTMNKFFGVDCIECGKPFPKSLMVTLNGSGLMKEFSGQYCVVCYHKVVSQFDYCSDCGDEYPKEHLYKSLTDRKTILCLACLNREEDE